MDKYNCTALCTALCIAGMPKKYYYPAQNEKGDHKWFIASEELHQKLQKISLGKPIKLIIKE